jgi:hypothetical protein
MAAAVLSAAVVAMVVLAAVFLRQEKLLYYPERAPVERLVQGSGLAPWPSAGDFRALLAEPAAGAASVRGTVVVFHGNAGHAGHRMHYAQALAPLGWRVLLAEHPGYGPRAGALDERSLVDDAAQTVERAHAQYGAPLLVVGESLGAAVAAGAAGAQRERVAGLVLITPWDRLAHVAAHHYPWLPVRWMLRDDYDSAARLAGFARPVAVVAAEHDTLVPPRFARALYDGLAGPKRWVEIAGRGHNDWPDRADAAWWRSVLGFASGAE